MFSLNLKRKIIFLRRLDALGRVPQDVILVTADVVNL